MSNTISINSKIVGADETDYFQISESAINNLKESIKENNVPDSYFVRINNKSGGCKGMTFNLEFDYNINQNVDKEMIAEGIRLICDNKTLFYLMGITLDYVSDENASGYVFRGYRDYPVCGCNS